MIASIRLAQFSDPKYEVRVRRRRSQPIFFVTNLTYNTIWTQVLIS